MGQYMVEPKASPNLNIPESEATVQVSIIDTTSRIDIPMVPLMGKAVIGGLERLTVPAFSFLVKNSSTGRTILFDLGVRKDFAENGPTGLIKRLDGVGFKTEIKQNVVDILEAHEINPKDIEAIIWSHYHFDHTGDPSTFPSSTALIVGPGVKGRFPKAFPTDPEAAVSEDAWADREWIEISFEKASLRIGRFQAYDFFGDGSFYLLNAPGHVLGHMAALARTTKNTFILMGADTAHHGGEFRPTEYRPFPNEIAIETLPTSIGLPCPSHVYIDHVHPAHAPDKPFFVDTAGWNEDPKVADWSVDGLKEFDADERVFSVIAHDPTILGVVDMFPKVANEWKAKDWAKQCRWRFLTDFNPALEQLRKENKL